MCITCRHCCLPVIFFGSQGDHCCSSVVAFEGLLLIAIDRLAKTSPLAVQCHQLPCIANRVACSTVTCQRHSVLRAGSNCISFGLLVVVVLCPLDSLQVNWCSNAAIGWCLTGLSCRNRLHSENGLLTRVDCSAHPHCLLCPSLEWLCC